MKPSSARSHDAGLNRFQALVDNAPDGLITIDRRGTVETFNPACAGIFGYAAEEVIGRDVKMLMPEPYHSECDGYLRRYRESGEPTIIGAARREASGRRKDGSVFTLELSLSAFALEDGLHYCGIVRDVTLRQQTTHDLVQGKERYDLAVRGMSVGLWDWNVATNDVYWTEKFDSFLGITDPAYKPSLDDFAARLHPDDREAVMGALFGHLRHLGPYNVEYRIRRNDGKYIWLHASGQALWDAEGKPLRMVGSVADIDQRKAAEAQRQHLMEKLMQSNTELERFAYVASHDLQEPVRMVMNFSQMIARDYGDRLDAEGREYMKFVTESADRIHGMIDDLLDYARMGSEERSLVAVDGATELRHVLVNLGQLIEKSGAEVTCDPLPEFTGNPVQFMRLMQNLISNAIKYQPPGNKPRVHVGVGDQGSAWRISVKDNGIGIDEAFTRQIFEPFRRLHSWEQIKGTGIGLAVCKKIVENHGGEIWVESVPHQGSTFFVTISKSLSDRQRAA